MPMIIISTAVPFPLRVIVEKHKKSKLPKKKEPENIKLQKTSQKGLIGYSNKIANVRKKTN